MSQSKLIFGKIIIKNLQVLQILQALIMKICSILELMLIIKISMNNLQMNQKAQK